MSLPAQKKKKLQQSLINQNKTIGEKKGAKKGKNIFRHSIQNKGGQKKIERYLKWLKKKKKTA